MKAVIMGATSGIGREVALILAEKGWKVGVAGRRADLLESLRQENANITDYETIDVTKDDATERLLSLIERMDGIDLYFHSSGIGYQNVELDEEKELSTIMTNCLGMARMTGEMFRYFEKHNEHRGHIAVISSIARTKGLGAAPAYSASKRFTSNYLESLEQLKSIKGIRHIDITDIRPGFVRTPLIEGSHFPCQLAAKDVARGIVSALKHRKKVVTINRLYRLVVIFWQMIPRWLWIRLRVH